MGLRSYSLIHKEIHSKYAIQQYAFSKRLIEVFDAQSPLRDSNTLFALWGSLSPKTARAKWLLFFSMAPEHSAASIGRET